MNSKQSIWQNDEELFKIAKDELFVALVGDILDSLGYQHQFLPPNIKPLSDHFVLIGRAMTVLEADVDHLSDGIKNKTGIDQPFGRMFEALDQLKKNEVYICTGASPSYALWGGLMSTRAIKLQAAGAVLDGWSRDTNEVLRLNFPTFSYGGFAQDQGPRGKVVDFRVSIEIKGTRINPGDIVYGDRDGVLIVPKEVVDEAFTGAIEKARGEQLVKRALESGMSSVEAFRKFGIM